MRSKIPALIVLAIAATALLAACGDDDVDRGAAASDTAADGADATTGRSADEGATVTIERSRFSPDPIEVAPGAEVTFENLDPYAHTVTAHAESTLSFDSGELDQGETFVQAFDEPGTYAYFCDIHPTMRAEVVVE